MISIVMGSGSKCRVAFGYFISGSVWVNIVGLSGFKNMELLTPSAFFIAFLLVLQWVAYFWVRVGSVYDYLGYGSGKGIALSLKPGTRVPSGNMRVVRLSKNYVKISP